MAKPYDPTTEKDVQVLFENSASPQGLFPAVIVLALFGGVGFLGGFVTSYFIRGLPPMPAQLLVPWGVLVPLVICDYLSHRFKVVTRSPMTWLKDYYKLNFIGRYACFCLEGDELQCFLTSRSDFQSHGYLDAPIVIRVKLGGWFKRNAIVVHCREAAYWSIKKVALERDKHFAPAVTLADKNGVAMSLHIKVALVYLDELLGIANGEDPYRDWGEMVVTCQLNRKDLRSRLDTICASVDGAMEKISLRRQGSPSKNEARTREDLMKALVEVLDPRSPLFEKYNAQKEVT